MQARRKTLPIFLVGLAASLLLSACGGGSTGSTWFNVPSVPVRVQEDGSASVYGFNLGPVIAPAVVSQLEAADVEKLDVRVGYEGIQPLLNGQTLPYVNWDEDSVAELQNVVETLPNIPNAGLISRALPMLRTVGTGLALKLPGADSVRAWDGTETSITPSGSEQVAVGPMQIGGMAVDEQGGLSLQGISLADLGAAVSLPPEVMTLVNQLGVERLTVDTSPNGIQLGLDGRALPGLTFDSETLDRALGVAGAFVDEGTQATLEQVAPLLKSSDINLDLSFTGEPAGETDLGDLSVEVLEDGTLSAFGIPLGGQPVLDSATLAQIQDAGIQNLAVNVGENGLGLAANGVKLPSISWSDESLPVLADTIGGLAGIAPETIEGGLNILRSAGVNANITLPPKAGERTLEMPETIDFTYAPAELGDITQPEIKLNATLNPDGSIAEVAGLNETALAALGLSGPVVPSNVMAILAGLNADELRIVGEPNMLRLYLDGNEALSVAHDAESLAGALDVAAPFLGDSPLADPVVDEFLRNVILPMIPGTGLDITVSLG
jgi:hypothetical protein